MGIGREFADKEDHWNMQDFMSFDMRQNGREELARTAEGAEIIAGFEREQRLGEGSEPEGLP